jgi:hypothetical protein
MTVSAGLIDVMAASDNHEEAVRLAAALLARQLVDSLDRSISVDVQRVEEPLLLALCDSNRSVRTAAAGCIAAFARAEFSDRGSGWPSLPHKLEQLCTSGIAAHAVGAATCLQILSEDCAVAIVDAEGEEAAALREHLLRLIVGLIDSAADQQVRRKAISASTHFFKAASQPSTFDLDDYDDDGEEKAEHRQQRHATYGQQQLEGLVHTLAPRFVTFLEGTVEALAAGGADALAAAVSPGGAAASQWEELGVAIDGIVSMCKFDEAIAPYLGRGVQAAAALFCAAAGAASSQAGHDALAWDAELESAMHQFGRTTLEFFADIVVTEDASVDTLRHMDHGASSSAIALAALSARSNQQRPHPSSLSAAFYQAVLAFGTRMTEAERSELELGPDAHIAETGADVLFARSKGAGNADHDEGDVNDADESSDDDEDNEKLSALRHATSFLLTIMSSVMPDEMLDGILPVLAPTLSPDTGAASVPWTIMEGALLIASVLIDGALRPLVDRDAAGPMLDVCVALVQQPDLAAPIRSGACKCLEKFTTSLVDLACATVKRERLSMTTLAPVGARCIAALATPLTDCNKAVQQSAFHALNELMKHVLDYAQDEDEQASELDDDEEDIGDDDDVGSSLYALMPDATLAGMYNTLASNCSHYQVSSRACLYDLIAAIAETDKALAPLRPGQLRGRIVLRDPALRDAVLVGLCAHWEALTDLDASTTDLVVYESAAVAECLGRVALVCGPEAAPVVPRIAAKCTAVFSLMTAKRSTALADESLVTGCVDLISAICDAIGPTLAFQHVLSPELLAASGALSATPSDSPNAAEVHRSAFSLLGDFGACVGGMQTARLQEAAGHVTLDAIAAVVAECPGRGDDVQARALVNCAKSMWREICAMVLPRFPLATKAARRGFTEKELAALRTASGEEAPRGRRGK